MDVSMCILGFQKSGFCFSPLFSGTISFRYIAVFNSHKLTIRSVASTESERFMLWPVICTCPNSGVKREERQRWEKVVNQTSSFNASFSTKDNTQVTIIDSPLSL